MLCCVHLVQVAAWVAAFTLHACQGVVPGCFPFRRFWFCISDHSSLWVCWSSSLGCNMLALCEVHALMHSDTTAASACASLCTCAIGTFAKAFVRLNHQEVDSCAVQVIGSPLILLSLSSQVQVRLAFIRLPAHLVP